MSFLSCSESNPEGHGYSFGHCFPVGVHMAQYSGDFLVWLDSGTVDGCANVQDASVCWVGIMTSAVGLT